MSQRTILATYAFGAAMGIASWEFARWMGRDTRHPFPGCCCELCEKDFVARAGAQRACAERVEAFERAERARK